MLYARVACCGLQAAVDILTEAGLPVPARTGVLTYEPTLECDCSGLYVRPLDSRNIVEPNEWACNVQQRVIEWELSISRCVNVGLDTGCGDPFTCDDMPIVCPGEPLPEWPTDPCSTQIGAAAEAALILTDRQVLESFQAAQWRYCYCEALGACCPDCDNSGCVEVRFVSSRPFDSGGCGGTIMLFETRHP